MREPYGVVAGVSVVKGDTGRRMGQRTLQTSRNRFIERQNMEVLLKVGDLLNECLLLNHAPIGKRQWIAHEPVIHDDGQGPGPKQVVYPPAQTCWFMPSCILHKMAVKLGCLVFCQCQSSGIRW